MRGTFFAFEVTAMRASSARSNSGKKGPLGPILLAFGNGAAAARLAAILLARGDTVLTPSDEDGLLTAIAESRPRLVLTDIPLRAVDPYTLRRLHYAAARYPVVVRSLPESDSGLVALADQLPRDIRRSDPGARS